MGKLTAADRKDLPKSDFAIPSKAPGSGSYPIEDRAHAANALSRVDDNGSAAEKSEVRQAVKSKYPGMGKSDNDADDPPPKRSSPSKAGPPGQKYNPKTAARGVPYTTGQGERQLDGSRTPTMSKPTSKQPMAERQPAPHRPASQGGSGLEASMGALADQLHPRTSKPKRSLSY